MLTVVRTGRINTWRYEKDDRVRNKALGRILGHLGLWKWLWR